MNFGNYFIGQNFSEIIGEITEISKAEYSVLKLSFANEKIFHGKQIDFCGVLWNSVIGVVQGKIYKISLKTHTSEKKFDISEDRLWSKVFHKLNNEFEIYTDQQKVGDSFVTTWDTKFGNIIFNSTTLPNENILPLSNQSVLDITLTGNFAFRRVKKRQQIGLSIFLIAGIIISQYVTPTIAFIIFIMLGLTHGRRIDLFLGKFFLKSIIKKGYFFSSAYFGEFLLHLESENCFSSMTQIFF